MPNISIKNLYYFSLIFICFIISHIIVIIYLAFFSSHHLYLELNQKYELYKFSELPSNEKTLRGRNNLFKYYICPFNIRHKALAVNLKNTGIGFWALAFYNHKGTLIYSVNNQLIHNKDLNLIIGSQMELSLLKKYYNNADLNAATIVPRDIVNGMAILKIYAVSKNEHIQAKTLVSNASCKALM